MNSNGLGFTTPVFAVLQMQSLVLFCRVPIDTNETKALVTIENHSECKPPPNRAFFQKKKSQKSSITLFYYAVHEDKF